VLINLAPCSLCRPSNAIVLVTLPRAQNIAKFLQRTSDKLCLLPQVRGQVSVRVADSDEGSLEGILKGFGRAGRGSVDVVYASEL
jgi:hypothetical protein